MPMTDLDKLKAAAEAATPPERETMEDLQLTPMDYDPFDGDFGAPGDTVLSDAMVKARKPHECSHCNGQISVGETHRSRYEKSDGEMRKWRWCAACCEAMVKEMEAYYAEEEPEDPYPFQHRHGLLTC